MSDNTPTERFDAAGQAPTERLSAPVPSATVTPERASRRLIIVLVIIGAVLLIAVLIVLVLLLTRGSTAPVALPTASTAQTPSASPTPSAAATPTPTPTATPSPTPTQPASDNSVHFTSLTPVDQVQCYHSEAQNFSPPPIKIEVSWTSKNANVAWFAANSNDASADQFMQIPTNGNQDNFQYEIDFPCYQKSISYTITLVGDNNEKSTKKWTVTNTGYVTK